LPVVYFPYEPIETLVASFTRRYTSKKGVASTKGRAAAAVAGRTAYREEYPRDYYGPDLDESLDGTESGHEF
jgi:hypothetical protein